MRAIEEFLIREERAHNIWLINFKDYYLDLRSRLVDKYGDEPMKKKDEQLLKKWEREIESNEKDQRQEGE